VRKREKREKGTPNTTKTALFLAPKRIENEGVKEGERVEIMRSLAARWANCLIEPQA
jgi:hypothetical protein